MLSYAAFGERFSWMVQACSRCIFLLSFALRLTVALLLPCIWGAIFLVDASLLTLYFPALLVFTF